MSLTVQFTDTSTGDVIDWFWDFDDGTFDTAPNPLHIFPYPGNYNVTLHILGAYGGYDTNTQVVSVFDAVTIDVLPVPAGTNIPISSLGVSAPTLLDWGDGFTEIINGTAARSHVYPVAGDYFITIATPENVTSLHVASTYLVIDSAIINSLINIQAFQTTFPVRGVLDSADLVRWRPDSFISTYTVNLTGTFNSADIAAWNPTTFDVRSITAGTFDSADIAAWNPTTFTLTGVPLGTFDSADIATWSPTEFWLSGFGAGTTSTLNSADIAAWNPTVFIISAMPASFGGVFDFSDLSGWNPISFIMIIPASSITGSFSGNDVLGWNPIYVDIEDMPVGFTFTITGSIFSTWTTATNIRFYSSFTPAQVNTILLGIYAAFAGRTAVNGTINVAGSNAAPNGLFAAQCPPTLGKYAAYELENDSCLINPAHIWANVIYT